ncbi:MAG: DUF6580 family putative transport protein [Planctomycetota bacterium]
MSEDRNPTAPVLLPHALIALLLIAIGVVGRWGQPDWCVTPLAAVGLLAGYALPRRWALLVPLAALAASDGLLPTYGSAGVVISVYAVMIVPALLGVWLRRPVNSVTTGVARLVGVSALPSVTFFFTTNFAVWAFQSLYPKTLAGLAECYIAALPFFRRMLVGDVAYTGLLFAAAAIAGAYSLRGRPAENASGELIVER